MYTFMAIRINQGKLTWDEVATFKPEAQEAIKAAYKKKYPDEKIPGDEEDTEE